MGASKLKIFRELNDYTQQHVADVLGITQNTYSRLEHNPAKLTAEQAGKLSELYNISVPDLLSNETPIIFSNSNSTIDKNGFFSSNYEFQKDSLEREIQSLKEAFSREVRNLKEEVEYLREQNKQLLALLQK